MCSFLPAWPDSGDDYVSRESGNRKEGANQNNVGSGEGSQETEKVTNDSGTDDTAQETFPCLVRTYFRKNLMPSEKFAPDKLHDIIDFRKEYMVYSEHDMDMSMRILICRWPR